MFLGRIHAGNDIPQGPWARASSPATGAASHNRSSPNLLVT